MKRLENQTTEQSFQHTGNDTGNCRSQWINTEQHGSKGSHTEALHKAGDTKARPQMAPPFGPKIMAPTATGTVKKVMERPMVWKYPSGVNAMMKIMATISASSTINNVFCECVFFIFLSFCPVKRRSKGKRPLSPGSCLISGENKMNETSEKPQICGQTKHKIQKSLFS